MTPDRSPTGALLAFLKSLPIMVLILLAIPFLTPSLTEKCVTPLLPLARPVAQGPDPDETSLWAMLGALRQENIRLKKTLLLLGREEKDQAAATGILARNLGQTPELFRQSIVLDAGQKDGVATGSVIVHSGHLIGLVDACRPEWSRTRLLADPEFRITVEVVGTDNRPPPTEGWVRALAGGRDPARGDGAVMIHHFPRARRQDIQLGDMVVTNGRDFQTPAGLLVGRIASIEIRELFMEILLEVPNPAALNLLRILPPPENPFTQSPP
jgi:rod shape-determining protein MreC